MPALSFASSFPCPHWIVTVKFNEDTGEPLVAVPVSTALLLPVGPVVLFEAGVLVLLLPPPQAAIAVTSARASSRLAMFQPSCQPRKLRSRVDSTIARTIEIAPTAHPLVPQG